VASYSAVLSRLALVAAAVAVVVLLASSARGYDACEQARKDVIGAAAGALPPSRQAPAIAAIRERCRGAQSLISAAAVLHRQDRDREAQALAQEAVDREPENATAWNGVAITAARRDPATARRAAARALALSPLDPPAVPLRAAGAARP
jgi:hypothetical protein